MRLSEKGTAHAGNPARSPLCRLLITLCIDPSICSAGQLSVLHSPRPLRCSAVRRTAEWRVGRRTLPAAVVGSTLRTRSRCEPPFAISVAAAGGGAAESLAIPSGCIDTKRRSPLAPLTHCAADSADGCPSKVSGKLHERKIHSCCNPERPRGQSGKWDAWRSEGGGAHRSS